jgi:hypothetical protein
MTTVIKHSLRASAATAGSLRPAGWHPRLSMQLTGPTPAGAELIWCVSRPDGSPWFEYRAPLPELEAEGATVVDLQRWAEDDLSVPGVVAFTLRIVSVLDGVDELLHEGSLTAVALEGEQRYAVDNDWLLTVALLGLDVVGEHDAPRLTATTFLKGAADDYRLEGACFHDGRRIAMASSVSTYRTLTANDGAVAGQEVVIEFDGVRGWNNLRDSGWGGDWHLLDEHDGAYEVKLLREGAIARVIAFQVAEGRMVAPGPVEADSAVGTVALVEARVEGVLDGEWRRDGASAFYGDAATAAHWVSIDELYAARVEAVVAPPPAFDEETTAALQAFVDRAERLILTWEFDLTTTPPPYDYGQVLMAEGVLREREDYLVLAGRVDGVADEHPVALSGEPTTAGDLRRRVAAIFTAAEARITGAAQAADDVLAPYRALLAGDKLAVFEDHPADAFLYTTTDRRVIETPEELAAAEYWYFEGPLDLPSTASVNGVSMKVTVQGWRVLGWRFDSDGAIVEEFETQGPGATAPKSAFQHGR